MLKCVRDLKVQILKMRKITKRLIILILFTFIVGYFVHKIGYHENETKIKSTILSTTTRATILQNSEIIKSVSKEFDTYGTEKTVEEVTKIYNSTINGPNGLKRIPSSTGSIGSNDSVDQIASNGSNGQNGSNSRNIPIDTNEIIVENEILLDEQPKTDFKSRSNHLNKFCKTKSKTSKRYPLELFVLKERNLAWCPVPKARFTDF